MNKYIVAYFNPELADGEGMECRWHCTASCSQHAVDMLRKMFADIEITIRTVSYLVDMKGEWK